MSFQWFHIIHHANLKISSWNSQNLKFSSIFTAEIGGFSSGVILKFPLDVTMVHTAQLDAEQSHEHSDVKYIYIYIYYIFVYLIYVCVERIWFKF